MLDAGVVDVAIGLAFVYLLLSLICSAFTEWISRIFALRSGNLEEGIRSLLREDSTNETSGNLVIKATNFLDHPIMKGFSPKRWLGSSKGKYAKPSYIPSRAFAAVTMDLLVPAKKGGTPPGIEEIRTSIETLKNQDLQRALLVLLQQGEQNVNAFRTAVEQWFDDGMDRASGWYKRNIQFILLGVAPVVAGSFNADTFLIGQTLWRDEALRNAVASAAGEYVEERTEAEADDHDEQLKADVEVLTLQLEELELPLGWSNDDYVPDGHPGEDPVGWLAKLGGLLVTAIALSLGAPFWFDLLNRLVNLRSTGSLPKKSNDTERSYGSIA